MKRTGLGLVLVSTVLAMTTLVGCSTSKATINSYTEPAFDSSSMRTVAVLPIRNAKFAPSESHQINRKVAQGLQRLGVQVKGAAESVTILNDAGLADEYAVFLANYTSSGVPNREQLKRIAQSLDVDGIMQGEIVKVYQRDGSFGYVQGFSRITVRYSILDGRNGSMVLDATSDGLKVTATTVEVAPAMIEAVNVAIDKILDALPFGSSKKDEQ